MSDSSSDTGTATFSAGPLMEAARQIRPAQGWDGSARGYRPWRALPLLVEVGRQGTRRRTRVMVATIAMTPWLVALVFAFGPGTAPAGDLNAVNLGDRGAANFAVATLIVSSSILLMAVFALFAADALTSDIKWSTLRSLLAAPVPRGQLLLRKFAASLVFAAASVILLMAGSLIAGGVCFGWGPLQTPGGQTLPWGTAALRLIMITGYLVIIYLPTLAVAFTSGVFTRSTFGALGGVALFMTLSGVLDQLPTMGHLRWLLPTHYLYTWTDLISPIPPWDVLARSVVVAFAHSAFFLLLARRQFSRTDVLG